MKKVVLLDRDGTINVDYGFVHKIEDWDFVDGALEGMRRLLTAGFELGVAIYRIPAAKPVVAGRTPRRNKSPYRTAENRILIFLCRDGGNIPVNRTHRASAGQFSLTFIVAGITSYCLPIPATRWLRSPQPPLCAGQFRNGFRRCCGPQSHPSFRSSPIRLAG